MMKLSYWHYECRMFYFFFESRNSTTDPVVIWLTGGPGCSSEMALFYENGPFTIADNLTLLRNEYGWDQVLELVLVITSLYCYDAQTIIFLNSANYC